MNSANNKTDVIIIGAGPAGITAAVQLKRMEIDFVLIEKNIPGGLVRNANCIENYPGFPGGITGQKFASLLRHHLKKQDIEITKEQVLFVDFEDNEFILRADSQVFRSEYLIIASGTNPNTYNDIAIQQAANQFIIPEIACLPKLKYVRNDFEPIFAIIGSGDAAFDYALNLARHDLRSDIFMRSEKCKALPKLIDKADENDFAFLINIHKNYKLESVSLNEKHNYDNQTIKLTFDNNGNIVEHICNYLLFAIGRQPNQGFLTRAFIPKIVELEQSKRLFFAGDVKNKNDRQLSIAVGDAMKAAMTIYHELFPYG